MIFAVAVLAASCSMEGEYTETYPYLSTFDYTDKVYREQFGSDSLYFDTRYGTGLTWADVAFLHKTTEDKQTFLGGFILSHLKGKVYSQGDEPDKDVDLYRVNAPADIITLLS